MESWNHYIQSAVPDFAKFGLKVVLAVVVFFVGRRLIRWIVKILRHWMKKVNVDAGVVQFACSLAKFALYVFLLFNIAMSLGVKESSVAALLGTAGLSVGLALQGGLANLAGGVMLLLFKPFQVGDYIVQNQQDGCEGTVSRIEMCYTTLRTVDNRYILIPNGSLSNSTIINVTADENRKLVIKVNISYDSDLNKAREILEKLLIEDECTQTADGMNVYVDELGDSAVVMGVMVWVPTADYWPTKWHLNQRIKEEFDANGIRIPYRQLEVHVNRDEK